MTPANRRLHSLPAEISRFGGRQRDIAEIVRRLEATRLLTLTGGGGIGKSRLAARVAAVVNARYSGGVWLAGLADLTEPSLVAPSLAQALGLVDHPGRPLLYAAGAFL